MNAAKQRQILSWILADRSLWIQVAPFLKPEFFSDPDVHKTVGYIDQFVKDHKQLPTETVIKTELGFDPLEKFNSTEPSEAERSYIISELEIFYKHSALQEFLIEGVDMLQAESVDYGSLESRMKEIVQASMKIDVGLDYFNTIFDRLTELDKPSFHVSTGYGEMDKMMGGGWEPSEMYLVAGATGAGKSIFLANFASKNVMQGKDVLVITLELHEKIFGLRFDQILLDKTRDLIMVDKSRTNKTLLRLNEATGGSLIIKYFPTGSLTTHMIEGYLENYFLEMGKYPDIIHLDYMSLMRPNEKMRDANTYVMEKFISEELRGLAGQLEKPLISASQLNRAGMDSAIPDKSAIADSVGKLFTVGGLFNISQTKAEKAMGLTKLYCAKGRNIPSDWMTTFKINYESLRVTELDTILNIGSEAIATKSGPTSQDYGGIS